MRPLLTAILFVFLSISAFAQLSGTIGVSKRNEDVGNPYGKKLVDQLFMNSIGERFRHDIYTLGIDHQKNHLLISGEISYTYSSYHEHLESFYIDGGHFGSSTVNEIRDLDISYSHFGLKFSPSYVIAPSKKVNLAVGGFFHLEFLTHEEEANHQTETTYKSTYQTYNPQDSTVSYVTTTNTYHSDDEFDAYTIYGAHAALGISLLPRITFSNFILEFPCSFGFNLNPRTIQTIRTSQYSDPNQGTKMFTELGFKLGYVIKQYN